MDRSSRSAGVRVLGRRSRVVGGAAATLACLVTAGVWAVGASAEEGGGARALCTPYPSNSGGCMTGSTSLPPSGSQGSSGGVTPSPDPTPSPDVTSPPPPPTPSGTPSTRRSYTWTFEDGTPGGWYGYPAAGSVVGPWVAPSPTAAASGRGGLLVGAVSRWGVGVAVDVSRVTVVPGAYAVSARVRLTPGQPATTFQVGGAVKTYADGASDATWATVTGSLQVPADGSAVRLTIVPAVGGCHGANPEDVAPATTFQLDDVSLTRTGDVVPTPTLTTPVDCNSPVPPATAKIHYEVTSVGATGFTATLVLTNLRDTPITGWRVPLYASSNRITWVSGARVVAASETTSGTGLAGADGAPDIPAYGKVRISVGLSGSPVGSSNLFSSIVGQQTGRD